MPKLKRPPVFREDGTIELQLTKGYVAIIDAVDAHLAGFNWYVTARSGNLAYAARGDGVTFLHREIMGLERRGGSEVDHMDGDSLNCRRSNLRIVTRRDNLRNKIKRSDNTSGHVGVHYDKGKDRWVARICRKTIGEFRIKADAVQARLAREKAEWGIQPRRAEAHEEDAKLRDFSGFGG